MTDFDTAFQSVSIILVTFMPECAYIVLFVYIDFSPRMYKFLVVTNPPF